MSQKKLDSPSSFFKSQLSRAGFEPTTFGSGGRHSIQLSYRDGKRIARGAPRHGDYPEIRSGFQVRGEKEVGWWVALRGKKQVMVRKTAVRMEMARPVENEVGAYWQLIRVRPAGMLRLR